MTNKKQSHQWALTLKELWKYLARDKRQFVGAIILTFIKTGISIFLSIAVGFLLQLSVQRLTDPNPSVVNEGWIFLLGGSGVLIAGYVIFFIFYLIASKIVIKVSFGLGYKIRDLIFMKIHKFPYSLLQQKMSGDLMGRATTDVNALALNMSVSASNVFTTPAIMLGVYIGLFVLSPYLALISLGIFFFVLGGSFVFAKLSAPKYKQMQTEMGNMNIEVEEQISNRKVIKLFSLQEQAYDQFKRYNEKQRKVTQSAEIAVSFIWPWSNLVENIMLSALYLVAIALSINDITFSTVMFNPISGTQGSIDSTVAVLTSFVLLARQANGEATNALRLIGNVEKMFVAAERSLSILDNPDYIDEGKNKLTDIKGAITFENVHFGYQPAKPILKDISFHVPAQSVTAIVGPTGSGKTTIVNLLSRFYEINSGTIKIDNTDIRTVTQQSLCDNIAVVLQDSFLFSESIRQNIAYGNKDATEADIKEAAKAANVDRFIEMLPNKYDTIVSERINDFSNGEIQLLALARAFLSKAKILILDEATSSVDTKTETDIQNALLKLMKTRTVIVIAHRLSTIVNADQIIVVHNGNLLEKGTHDELLEQKGFYYDLYQANAVMAEN
ncbi:ABC transporter ATP-binding protein [[Mycoplasma] testudinis]|uniref:ABC transporter ATP-binding protein n=1 Tax=[Mycoplasma] testudinis TaxID=33924 RepID=UPI0004859078|nr:ABC transporter ATP-binding protein [[Mycoplasma] testudinis]